MGYLSYEAMPGEGKNDNVDHAALDVLLLLLIWLLFREFVHTIEAHHLDYSCPALYRCRNSW